MHYKKNILDNLVVIVFKVLAKCPLAWIQGLGRFIGSLLFYLPTSERKVTQVNLAIAASTQTQLSPSSVAKKSLQHCSMTMVELTAIWQWPPEKILHLVKEVQKETLIKDTLNHKKGIVLLVPHLGQWEMINAYVATHYPLTSLYKPSRFSKLNKLMRAGRAQFGGTLLPAEPRSIKKLYQVLKQGQIVGILPDQVPPEHSGVFAKLYDKDVLTMSLPLRFLKKSGAQAIFAFAQRLTGSENKRGYRIVFMPAPKEIYDEDIVIAAKAMNEGVQQCISHCPEQYLWSYKRFKRLKKKEDEPY